MSIHTGRTMTRLEYDAEIQSGVIEEGEPVELLAGRIVDVSPEDASHASVQRRLVRALYLQLDVDRWVISHGNPIALSDLDEPEPDVAVFRARPDDYGVSHPEPSETALVIEVANSSHRRDLVLKAQRYALAGIRDYWVVDLINQVTVVHRQPVDGTYRSIEHVPAGEAVEILDIPGVSLEPLPS